MFSPLTIRRLVVLTLVAVAVSWVLQGCATPDVICNMRANYQRPAAIPSHGSVTIHFAFGQVFAGQQYGSTFCGTEACFLSLKDTPHVNQPCTLARLGHEVVEAIAKGRAHE